VLIVDASSGGIIDDVEVARGWVTHVQFRPGDPATILFNHEWTEASGSRRLWIRDPAGIRPLRRTEGAWTDAPIDAADELEHETWTVDGSAVVYHGVSRGPGSSGGRPFVGRVTIADGLVTELALPSGSVRSGHLAAWDARTLVTDGIADPPDSTDDAGAGGRRSAAIRLDGADAPAEDDGGRWITRLDVDWSVRRIVPTPLVQHGSSWSSQDAHPHPVFDQTDRTVLFTSDRDGVRAVYRIEAGA
jgi:oligogalacturonide lyase